MATTTDQATGKKADKRNKKKRPYRLKKRARQQEETRERIVEAIVELHRTVGPAKTKVTEVADKAGVGRMTVYNHFPTEADLIDACSAHWSAQNPPPDPAAWAAIDDADERLRAALRALYRYYRDTADMMGKVLRDEPLVPALAHVMGKRWWPYVEAVIDVLSQGRNLRGARRPRVSAALRLAIDFSTWRTLTGSGLGDEDAAALAADLVAGA
jgi:AcrR family transcriptional regulator